MKTSYKAFRQIENSCEPVHDQPNAIQNQKYRQYYGICWFWIPRGMLDVKKHELKPGNSMAVSDKSFQLIPNQTNAHLIRK